MMESKSDLPEYSSDNEFDEEMQQTSKKSRVTKTWIQKKTFKDESEAQQYIVRAGIWSTSSTKECSNGSKKFFRCKKGSFRKDECPASLYLLFHEDSSKVTLFRTRDDHRHDETTKSGLSTAAKEVINKMYENGITHLPTILEAMRNKDISEPTKRQLYNYTAILRKSKCGSSRIGVNEIRDWCEARKCIPEDMDKPFVVSYKILAADPLENRREDLKVFMSTCRLLEISKVSSIIHIDSTCKLNWQGYPVLIVGTTDLDRQFHPFGLALCYSEAAEDFEFIFNSMKQYCNTHLNYDFKPQKLIADPADAITVGFEAVFGQEYKRLMCWFHVTQKIKEKTKCLGKCIKIQIKSDVDALQLCDSEVAFKSACKLFFDKWTSNADVQDFLLYFKQQWVEKYPLWYEGASERSPSTNNSLKGTNSSIKAQYTLRKRLPVGQLFHLLESKLLSEWSYQRSPTNPNNKNFSLSPSLSLKLWTKSYQWAVKFVKILLKGNPDRSDISVYHIQSSSSLEAKDDFSSEFTDGIISKYGKWKTFQEFCQLRSAMWSVNYVLHDWRNSTCSCPKYLKEYICKHIVGIALRLKHTRAPEEAKSVPLGQKRKRGRPSHAKAALLKD